MALARGTPSCPNDAAGSVTSGASSRALQLRRGRRRHTRPPQLAASAATGQGGSGIASFGSTTSTAGRTGSVGFRAEPPEPALAAPSADDNRNSSFWDLKRLRQQVQTLGLAGVTAYGLFNTLYYTVTFLFFWIWVAKVPSGQGVAATAKAFLGVMGLVWAGSQVTKAPRAAAALMLAPVVDRAMDWLQQLLGLRTRRAVFLVFVAACLSLAALVFGAVVLAWS